MRGSARIARSVAAGFVAATLAFTAQPVSAAVGSAAAPVPWWEAITSPRLFEVVHGVVPVTIAADPLVASVQLDGGEVVELTGPGPWTTSVDVSQRPSGTHAMEVVLRYREGVRAAHFQHQMVVDNDRPVIHVQPRQIDRTLLGSDVYGFTPWVADTSNRVRLDLLINDKIIDTRPYWPYWLYWDTRRVRNGRYKLTLRATDPFGQIGEVNRVVTVDTTPPRVVGLTPRHKAFVPGTFRVKANQVSDRYGVARVELYVDGKLVGRDTTAPYGFPVKRRNASWYRWNAFDRAGNLTTIERHFFLDTQRPSIRDIRAPGHRARVRGKVTVTLEASDGFGLVKRVQLLINGKVVARASKYPYRMTVDTRKQPKTMKVRFRAYDQAGNVRTTKARTWYRG